MTKKKNLKVILSVDAFGAMANKECLRATQFLLRHKRCALLPLFVQNDVFLHRTDFHRDAERSLSRLKGAGVAPARIVPNERSPYSLSAQVKLFVTEVQKERADLVVVRKAEKSAVERFLLGSFAEGLLFACRAPCLFIPPQKLRLKKRVVLFPTDFSKKSLKIFKQSLPFAQCMGASIVLFHKADFDSATDPLPDASRWLKAAKDAKVSTKLDCTLSRSSTADAILAATKRHHASMLFMAKNSGRTVSFLVGSLTRKILRISPTPVLVFH